MPFRSKNTHPKTIKTSSWLGWIFAAIAINLASLFPVFVGSIYTGLFFNFLTTGLRSITKLFPIALGELVYLILVISLIINIINYFSSIKIVNKFNDFWKQLVQNFTFWLLRIYVVFELIWGLNYHQSSPAKQFNLKLAKTYSEQDMDQLSLKLITELNNTSILIREDQNLSEGTLDSNFSKINLKMLFERSILEYQAIEIKYPQLVYKKPDLKIALFPKWGDYFGYLAFYQPLTAEAIIRPDLPILVQPFTICHEIAHQLGYASETEANFIAYIIGVESKDPIFRYAMQLQLFSYSQQAQLMLIAKTNDFKKWKQVVERNKSLLSPLVLMDRRKIRAFFLAKEGQRLAGTEKMYDQFLKWNKQANGIQSYDEVLLWALAYQKQYK